MDNQYLVLETFHDRALKKIVLKDSLYPPKGRKIPQEWVDKLLMGDNAVKRPLLKKMESTNVMEESKPKRSYAKRITETESGNASAES